MRIHFLLKYYIIGINLFNEFTIILEINKKKYQKNMRKPRNFHRVHIVNQFF